MSSSPRHLIVVGQGAAGLAAALSAAEAAQARNVVLSVTVVDKASEEDAGGNTRWSPSYMRMAAPDRVEESFVADILAATGGKGDPAYFEQLAAEAPSTMAWVASHGVEFIQPTYYLAKGPPRIQPKGGGIAFLDTLKSAARRAGVTFRYGCPAQTLITEGGRISGLALTDETVPADAVIIACGGFQGSPTMMHTHFGAGAETMRLISPGTRFNSGDGIAMAHAIGADLTGDWNGMHAEPVDARSKGSAPVVLVYPYGILVDRSGNRFCDEGGGLVHETWERLARDIHFNRPDSVAYAVLDSRMRDIAGYERAIRSEVPPYEAPTLKGLADLIGIDGERLAKTVAAYNAACTGDPTRFDATRCDGLAAEVTLSPSKSNWARGVEKPPFLAYPIVGAIAYTFGGLATDLAGHVLRDGRPVPGLYAAGEITGHFYGTAPNAVSMLRALVFGRLAGHAAVESLA